MPKILVICTANICRSPFAEALLEQRLKDAGFDDFVVESAGTWAQLERPPARYSIRLAREMGLAIESHRARMVDEEMLAAADLVLTMTASHKEALQVEFRQHAPRIFLLSEMAGSHFDVADPYGGPWEDYLEMQSDVVRLVDDGLRRIAAAAQHFARKRAEASSG